MFFETFDINIDEKILHLCNSCGVSEEQLKWILNAIWQQPKCGTKVKGHESLRKLIWEEAQVVIFYRWPGIGQEFDLCGIEKIVSKKTKS